MTNAEIGDVRVSQPGGHAPVGDESAELVVPPLTPEQKGEHYGLIAGAIKRGKVTPFLGAGVNTIGDDPAQPPDAERLAERLRLELAGSGIRPGDLARVAQAIDVKLGWGTLYDLLHREFAADYPPTQVHRFLATLPGVLRREGASQQLIVTTNYDDALERAFDEVGEPFDVVSYIAHPEDPNRGMFRRVRHVQVGELAGEEVIERANERNDIPATDRPTILKIHGAVDRDHCERDAFVITEDHYIEFMATTNLDQVLPVGIELRLAKTHTLFLGYTLRDWNLRVFLRTVWGDLKVPHDQRWAVQRDPKELDQKYWLRHHVEVLPIDLTEYVAGVKARL